MRHQTLALKQKQRPSLKSLRLCKGVGFSTSQCKKSQWLVFGAAFLLISTASIHYSEAAGNLFTPGGGFGGVGGPQWGPPGAPPGAPPAGSFGGLGVGGFGGAGTPGGMGMGMGGGMTGGMIGGMPMGGGMTEGLTIGGGGAMGAMGGGQTGGSLGALGGSFGLGSPTGVFGTKSLLASDPPNALGDSLSSKSNLGGAAGSGWGARTGTTGRKSTHPLFDAWEGLENGHMAIIGIADNALVQGNCFHLPNEKDMRLPCGTVYPGIPTLLKALTEGPEDPSNDSSAGGSFKSKLSGDSLRKPLIYVSSRVASETKTLKRVLNVQLDAAVKLGAAKADKGSESSWKSNNDPPTWAVDTFVNYEKGGAADETKSKVDKISAGISSNTGSPYSTGTSYIFFANSRASDFASLTALNLQSGGVIRAGFFSLVGEAMSTSRNRRKSRDVPVMETFLFTRNGRSVPAIRFDYNVKVVLDPSTAANLSASSMPTNLSVEIGVAFAKKLRTLVDHYLDHAPDSRNTYPVPIPVIFCKMKSLISGVDATKTKSEVVSIDIIQSKATSAAKLGTPYIFFNTAVSAATQAYILGMVDSSAIAESIRQTIQQLRSIGPLHQIYTVGFVNALRDDVTNTHAWIKSMSPGHLADSLAMLKLVLLNDHESASRYSSECTKALKYMDLNPSDPMFMFGMIYCTLYPQLDFLNTTGGHELEYLAIQIGKISRQIFSHSSGYGRRLSDYDPFEDSREAHWVSKEKQESRSNDGEVMSASQRDYRNSSMRGPKSADPRFDMDRDLDHSPPRQSQFGYENEFERGKRDFDRERLDRERIERGERPYDSLPYVSEHDRDDHREHRPLPYSDNRDSDYRPNRDDRRFKPFGASDHDNRDYNKYKPNHNANSDDRGYNTYNDNKRYRDRDQDRYDRPRDPYHNGDYHLEKPPRGSTDRNEYEYDRDPYGSKNKRYDDNEDDFYKRSSKQGAGLSQREKLSFINTSPLCQPKYDMKIQKSGRQELAERIANVDGRNMMSIYGCLWVSFSSMALKKGFLHDLIQTAEYKSGFKQDNPLVFPNRHLVIYSVLAGLGKGFSSISQARVRSKLRQQVLEDFAVPDDTQSWADALTGLKMLHEHFASVIKS